MSDLSAVLWKEWRELRAQNADMGGRGVVVAVVVLLPLVAGMAAVAPQIVRMRMILVICATPVLAVIGTICEAFAGERERHTLETLLASRITTEALLAGKILVNVLYAWSGAILLFLLIVIGANVPALGRHTILPTPGITLSVLVLMPLMLLFLCTAGVLVSLRSPTVRQAQSKLVMLFMGIVFAFLILGLVVRSFFPGVTADAKQMAGTPNFEIIAIAAWSVILIAVDLAMLLVVRLRFQRERMIVTR